jgi:hypothetical protein
MPGHVQGRRLTAEEAATAVAELKHAAAGWAAVLAECAGLVLGYGENEFDASRYRQIAELCIAAGALRIACHRAGQHQQWLTSDLVQPPDPARKGRAPAAAERMRLMPPRWAGHTGAPAGPGPAEPTDRAGAGIPTAATSRLTAASERDREATHTSGDEHRMGLMLPPRRLRHQPAAASWPPCRLSAHLQPRHDPAAETGRRP